MECIQFTGSNNAECSDFAGEKIDNTLKYPNVITPQGVVDVRVGDLIVKDNEGDLFVAGIRLPVKVVSESTVKVDLTPAELLCIEAFENPGRLYLIDSVSLWDKIKDVREAKALKIISINKKLYLTSWVEERN